MAAIDKIYLSDWEVFDKVRNWALDQKFTLKNGQVIKLRNYLYHPDLTKEEFEQYKKEYEEKHPGWTFEVVLWNTPVYVDIWLIRNCPFEEIQEELKGQYGGGWSKTAFTTHNDDDMYQQIKEGRSIYDTYQRNGLGKKAKVKIHTTYGSWIRDKKCFLSAEVNPHWIGGKKTKFHGNFDSYWYNEDDNMWYKDVEAMPWTCNHYHKVGSFTKKNIVNLVKKWDLPKGSIVYFDCSYKRYRAHEFYCTVE